MSSTDYPSPANTMSIQSYERKVSRLQIENLSLKEQLESMLFKVKSLQDVQTKYELLLGQSENENQQLRLGEYLLEKKLQQQIQKIIEQKDLETEQILKKLQQQHKSEILTLRQTHTASLQQQEQQYTELKSSHDNLLSKLSQIDVFSFKLKKYQKMNQQLEEQLETQKSLYEQTKERQLSEMKINITKKLKLKHEQEMQSYQQKIKSLNQKINQLELEKDLLEEKSKHTTLSEQTSNIEKLKDILNERKSIEKGQLTKMQQALDKANTTLRKMVQEKYEDQRRHLDRQEELKKYITQVEGEMLEQQKKHTQDIFTLQQKLKAMREEQVRELQSHIQQLRDSHEDEKKIWHDLSQRHKQQINEWQQRQHRMKAEFENQRRRLKSKIKQLSQRLEQHEGKRLQSETQQMIASFRDLDDREDKQANYENGLVFLQRQLRRANLVIQQKNEEITKLLRQHTQLRQQNEIEVNGWREKYRQQKKQFMDRIFQLENELRDLGDRLRIKEKELQKSQKQTSFEKIELEKKIQGLEDLNSELKKDYERVVALNKALETEYRGERDRGVTAVGDVTHVKRMKWLELEKQKNQLQIVFRQKEEQLKINYEKEIDDLRRQRDALRQRLVLIEDEKNKLKQQVDRVTKMNQNKENLKGQSTKKKSGQMEKKIASLNLQIALTKNLFQNLQKAKSRLKARQLSQNLQQQHRLDEQNEEDSF